MTTKKIILLGAICVNILYLLFAFANMSLNPKMWADSATGVCAILMGAVVLFTAEGVIITESSKNINHGDKEIHN